MIITIDLYRDSVQVSGKCITSKLRWNTNSATCCNEVWQIKGFGRPLNLTKLVKGAGLVSYTFNEDVFELEKILKKLGQQNFIFMEEFFDMTDQYYNINIKT